MLGDCTSGLVIILQFGRLLVNMVFGSNTVSELIVIPAGNLYMWLGYKLCNLILGISDIF